MYNGQDTLGPVYRPRSGLF